MDAIVAFIMDKKELSFGERLTRLRKNRGLTQEELGAIIGVSLRVISYYEAESQYPPTHLMPKLAKALKVSTDELLGIKNPKHGEEPAQVALLRRLRKAEKLSVRDRKALLHFLNALLKKNESDAA